MKVRALFTVNRIESVQYASNYTQKAVILTAQYDESIPEEQRFQKATPSGDIKMVIDNEAALAEFAPGKKFYVEFTEKE
jgi:hypothetical protein